MDKIALIYLRLFKNSKSTLLNLISFIYILLFVFLFIGLSVHIIQKEITGLYNNDKFVIIISAPISLILTYIIIKRFFGIEFKKVLARQVFMICFILFPIGFLFIKTIDIGLISFRAGISGLAASVLYALFIFWTDFKDYRARNQSKT